MWKNKVIMWEDSPQSIWNDFGKVVTIDNEIINEDELYAKGILLWRKTTLEEFVKKIISFFEYGNDFLEDKNILTGFMLAISTISIIPLHIEIIKDDEVADKFLSLIKREKTQYYFSKEDLQNSEFSKINSINILISKLIKKDILDETEDKYYIKGKVLTNIHIL